MRTFKSIGLATVAALGISSSPALAAGLKDLLKPMQVPAPRASDCTNSGFGQVCKRLVPPAVLTDDQVKTIQQWHNQNVEALKNQPAK